MADHSTEPAGTEEDSTPDPIEQRIMQAISDPGLVVPRETIPHVDSDLESIPHWGTRAVMTIVNELKQQRDDAVELVQACAGGDGVPSHADVILELFAKAQGDSTLADEVDRLRVLRADVSGRLGILNEDTGLEHQRITAKVEELVGNVGMLTWLQAEAEWQRDDLHNRLAGILLSFDHIPCLTYMCPGPRGESATRCSLCGARAALTALLANVRSETATEHAAVLVENADAATVLGNSCFDCHQPVAIVELVEVDINGQPQPMHRLCARTYLWPAEHEGCAT